MELKKNNSFTHFAIPSKLLFCKLYFICILYLGERKMGFLFIYFFNQNPTAQTKKILRNLV